MENEIKDNIKLPENAFTELKEGEEYQPVRAPTRLIPKSTAGRLHGVCSWPYSSRPLPHTLACA